MKALRVRVLQKHIDKAIKCGSHGSPRFCPIARAVRATTDKRRKEVVRVDAYTIQIGRKPYFTPKRAANFIWRFDDGKKVKPITFTLTN